MTFPPELVFPPTWVVIDNGNPGDKAVSEKIVEYLGNRLPPLFLRRVEVPPGETPDPFDLKAHGVIAVGGPSAHYGWLPKYNEQMDPKFIEDDGSLDFGIDGGVALPIHIVKSEPEPAELVGSGFLISSCVGDLPWLRIYMVAGIRAEDTILAGDMFCQGETRGVWRRTGEKLADP